jgi:hypothetical protein
MKRAVVLMALFALAGPAFADDAEAKDANVRYTKTTTVDFEDDMIEGEFARPDGEVIEATRRAEHGNLFRVRQEFNDKVMQSVGEL